MTDAPRAGLPGMIAGIRDVLTRSASAHDTWAIRLVFIAGIATILHKAGLPVPHYAAVFAVALGIAALLYEMHGTRSALREFWHGRPFAALGWGVIWFGAFAFSAINWLGAASSNEGSKSNMHQAAFITHGDTRKAVATAEREADRIEKRLAWMDTAVNGRPVRDVKSADADLDNARAHKFWRMTTECTETKGPQTRQFCADVAAWKSEKQLATARETLREELRVAKSERDAARKVAGNTKVETHEARSDLLIFTDYMGMSERTASFVMAAGSIIVISLFLSLASALNELQALRAAGPRVRIFSWGWARRAYRFLTGHEAPGAAIEGNTTVVLNNHSELARAIKRNIDGLANSVRLPRTA